jgi:hypothetical protein
MGQSAFDVLGSGHTGDLKILRGEVSDINFKFKKILDGGLTVDEYPSFAGLMAAAEAALAIVDNLYSQAA